MKVGKEGIAGTMAALQAWETRDHTTIREREREHLALWLDRLRNAPGLHARIVGDPTGNPLDRLEVAVSPSEAGTTAWMLAAELARGDPPIIVRDHEVANGHFFLDPCNLHPGEAEIVADRIASTLRALQGQPIEDVSTLERRRFAALSQWPD
jgi:L-seryl-tRNA(Ser) seleniumtransferase